MEHAPTALPARLARLPELARDLWWTWKPAREVFRRLDYGLWRQTAHNPVMMLQRIVAGRARARRRRSGVPRRCTTRRVAARDAARTPGASQRPGGTQHVGHRSERGRRLLLRGVRAASVAADLRRRPRRARRRSLQGGAATSACRSSASGSCIRRAISASASRRRAGSRRSTSGSTGTTRRSRTRAPSTASRASCSCRSARDRCSSRCGRSGSAACGCCCSTPTSSRTRRGIASCRRGCTAAGRTRGCSRRSCWASAACWRCARSACTPAVWHLNEGHAAFVVLQRLRDCLANGDGLGRRARRSAAHDGLHDAHAGARPDTTRFRSTWSSSSCRAAGDR